MRIAARQIKTIQSKENLIRLIRWNEGVCAQD